MSKDQIISVVKGAGIAAIGAGLTYLSEWASNTSFGEYTPVVVALLSVATNLVRKSLTKGEEDHVGTEQKAE